MYFHGKLWTFLEMELKTYFVKLFQYSTFGKTENVLLNSYTGFNKSSLEKGKATIFTYFSEHNHKHKVHRINCQKTTPSIILRINLETNSNKL